VRWLLGRAEAHRIAHRVGTIFVARTLDAAPLRQLAHEIAAVRVGITLEAAPGFGVANAHGAIRISEALDAFPALHGAGRMLLVAVLRARALYAVGPVAVRFLVLRAFRVRNTVESAFASSDVARAIRGAVLVAGALSTSA
jgi:hypothetical protein